MKLLQSAWIKWNIDKCKFIVPKEEYLWYIIMQEGIKPDQKQLESVINLDHPKD